VRDSTTSPSSQDRAGVPPLVPPARERPRRPSPPAGAASSGVQHGDRGMLAPVVDLHIAPPPGRPQPALQKIGFWGSIEEFNNRVAEAVRAHAAIKGFNPSPGLTLDLARSPIPVTHFEDMFKSAGSKTANDATNVLAKDKAENPHDYFVTRPDGVMATETPFTRMVAAAQPLPPEHPQHRTYQQLQKQYPNVQMGVLPIPGAENVYQALDVLNKQGGLQNALKQNGLTLPQFEEEVKRGRGVSPDVAGMVEMGSKLQQRQGATGGEQGPRLVLVGAALTLKEAQGQLNKAMGTKLPESGYFSPEWIDALSNWMKSASYFRTVTETQAKDAGFGSNVGAYLKSWKAKQSAVQKHGLSAHFLNAMPLALFGHGGLGGGLLSIPGYIVRGGGEPWTVGLHALQHSAGLALDTVGGTVQQAKGDLAAGSAFSHAIISKAFGSGKSYDEALKEAGTALRGNPTWLHALFPEVDFSKGSLADIDQATNIVGDFLLLRKPAFTGETIAAGDLPAAMRSSYVGATTHWAYDYLKSGEINRAASMLEGGQGANRLTAASAKLVKSGAMTQEQFGFHVAELYAKGRTVLTIKGKDYSVSGSVLHTLRTDKLPTPGVPGRALIVGKNHLRDTLDNLDKSLRGNNYASGDLSATMLGTVRSAFAHAIPHGARGMFDTTLPEAVFNYVMKNKLGDSPAELANTLETQVRRFQGRENVVGLQGVQRKLERLYHQKYSVSKSGGSGPGEFEALLGTEAPSQFHFPSGGAREVDGALSQIDSYRSSLNGALNNFAIKRSRLILVSGVSLFYKHAIADPLRAIVGGGLPGLGPEVQTAKREINALARTTPGYERKLGAFLAKATEGESRWLLGRGPTMAAKSFQAGDNFGKAKYMDAAGGYVRRLVTDDALAAYQHSTPGDLSPLVDLVLKNKTYRGMWQSAKGDAVRTEAQRLGVERLSREQSRNVLPAEEYAQQIASRFRDFSDAAQAAGVDDPFNRALTVLRQNRGSHANKALGDWLKDNRVDLTVQGVKVEKRGTFDSVTGTMLGKIMSPNKLTRRKFAENVLHKSFAEFRKAGFTPEDSFDIASTLAEAQVKYHMLDFANRLQIEQDLRYLSWFATKHRLYWKWVLGTFLRRPGAAAVTSDVQQHLDSNGNIPFEVFGHKLAVPAARLVWVPGQEYSETSPDVQFIQHVIQSGGDLSAGFSKAGNYGNTITRVDTAVRLGVKLARMGLGNVPATYGAATAGFDEKTKARFNRRINEYQLNYYAEHGHYNTDEASVVKHALMGATAEEAWRSILPLPVVPDYQPSSEQKLVRQFMSLVDPGKRRDFLDKHPGFSDHFGIYTDPRTYLHNHEMFGRFLTAVDAMRAARADIFTQAKTDGFSSDLLLQKRKIDAAFQKTFDTLLREDANWAGHTVGKDQVPGVAGVPYGPWGKLAAADPQIDPKHVLNALFPKLKTQDYGKVYGNTQRQLKQELALLNNPSYAATYPDPQELKTRRGEILQQLEVFKNLPSDALGATYAKYQSEHVSPYWRYIEHAVDAIKLLPSDETNAAYEDLRAWRDKQDHSIEVDGVKFPSPVRMAWATLDPQTRKERLSYFAAKSWAHLTSYEKELLTGKPVPASVSLAWQQIGKAVAEYRQANPGESISSDQILAAVKSADRNPEYKGILKDYLFSVKPLYQRLEVLPLVTESPFRKNWRDVFDAARTLSTAIKSGNYKSATLRAGWRNYVKSPAFQSWLDETPGFRKELDRFGPDLLNTLVG
jgi:hypothetical protein